MLGTWRVQLHVRKYTFYKGCEILHFASVTVTHLSTSVRSRSFIVQRASYWYYSIAYLNEEAFTDCVLIILIVLIRAVNVKYANGYLGDARLNGVTIH